MRRHWGIDAEVDGPTALITAGYTAAFTYTASDGSLSGTATVSVTVSDDDPPVAVNDTASTPEDTPRTIAVLGNDSDPEGNSLTVVAVGTPINGTASTNGNTVTSGDCPHVRRTSEVSLPATKQPAFCPRHAVL